MKEDSLIKVLFTIPNFDTAGSGKALLNIATRLDKNRFEAHICCFHNKGDLFKTVENSNIPIHIFQFTTDMKYRIKGLLNCFKIAQYFKQLNVDLIHSFHYAPDYSEAISAKLAGIPWVYTKKNMNWGGNSKNAWKLRTALATHIILQNKDMKMEFFPREKNVTLIPRGIDVEEFKPRLKNINLIKKFKILESEKVILTVANLVPVKGIETLLDSFALLLKTNNQIRLFIVGEKKNEYGRSMEEKANKSAAISKIHFTGKVQNVSDYYSIADVFVLPTLDKGRMEGCPVSLLEAMACGLPVVASDIPGVRDILEPFPECLYTAGDIRKLSEIILEAFNINNINKLGDLNMSHIGTHFSISKEVEQHQSIYHKCLNH